MAGGLNVYRFGPNAQAWVDPLGLWSWGDPLPQGLVDAVAGFGDGVYKTITLGIGDLNEIRKFAGIDGGVDQGSGKYFAGHVTGVVYAGLIPLAPKGINLGSKCQRVAHYNPANNIRKGLRAGDWVMTGNHTNRINYWLSGVKELGYPMSTGFSKTVPKSYLSWPKGWERIKGLWGQRIYTPPK